MTRDGFKREDMKDEVAKGDLNVEAKSKGKLNDETLKLLMNYQFKTNIVQSFIAIVMVVLGTVISFVNKDGIGITVGSLVQGDTTVSNITINLGALLIFTGFCALLIILKGSNTNYKDK